MKKTDFNALRISLNEENGAIGRKSRYTLLPALFCADVGLAHMLTEAVPRAELSFPTAVLVLCALSAGLMFLPKSTTALSLGCIALLLSGLFTLPLFRSGLLSVANSLREAICARTGRIILPLSGAEDSRAAYALWVLLLFFELLLCASVLGSGRLSALLCLLPFTLFWVLGFVRVDWGALLFLSGVAALLLRGRGGRNELTALLCVLLSLGAAYALKAESNLPDTLRSKLHELRYDSESNAMPEGDFRELGSLHKSETPALSVTLEVPQKLYLRGFTGETYTASGWEPLSNTEKAKWNESFYALHQSGYYALSSITAAEEVTGSLRAADISVQNESACSAQLYLPYALCGNELLDPELIGDSTARGEGSWSGKLSTGSVPDWFTTLASLSVMSSDETVNAYLRREALYRDFVESEYLSVPEETAELLSELIDLPEGGYTLSEIKDRILTVLKDEMSYDESEALRLKDRDFVTYVLENEKAGYSVHYATLATLMLRTMGVPARYVEGYFLSAAEAAEYKSGETITLTENHAHAWAEYYLDGVGWIPFETTPPYIDDEELNAGPGTGEEQKRIYEPPIKDSSTVEEPQDIYRPKRDREAARNLLLILLPLLLLLAILSVFLLLRKRRASLLRTLAAMDSAENRESIVLRYGYAQELLRHCILTEEIARELGCERAFALNREALFSAHPMRDEDRDFMVQYVRRLSELCLQQSNALRRFRLRYLDALIQ